MEIKRKLVGSILSVSLLIMITIGLSYAAFTFGQTGSVENSIQSGTISMTYSEGKTGIAIDNAFPISDEVGKQLSDSNQMFQFSVSVAITGNTEVMYEVSAIKKEDSTLQNNEVRLYLEKKQETDVAYSAVNNPAPYVPLASETEIGSIKGSMLLDQGVFTASTINQYCLRMWVSENTIMNDELRSFTVTIDVHGKQLSPNGIVEETRSLINSIDMVTLQSKETINQARSKYNLLTDEQKKTLGLALEGKLIQAEIDYTALVAQDKSTKIGKSNFRIVPQETEYVLRDDGKYNVLFWFSFVSDESFDQLLANYDILSVEYYYATSTSAIEDILNGVENKYAVKYAYNHDPGEFPDESDLTRYYGASGVAKGQTRVVKQLYRLKEKGSNFEYVIASDAVEATTPTT